MAALALSGGRGAGGGSAGPMNLMDGERTRRLATVVNTIDDAAAQASAPKATQRNAP